MNTKIKELLSSEIERIDAAGTTKRKEIVIEGFEKSEEYAPKAIIQGKTYAIFNSNDYLGLRLNETVREGEEKASQTFGTGPGAVRFISGSLLVHKQLEEALAHFHTREAGMVFSSAFATSMAVMHCFLKGQSKQSLVGSDVLVISDELNHRCIIDGIRLAGLSKEHKTIFKHLDLDGLSHILEENKGKYKRVVVVTDGIFSMLGEAQNVKKMQDICNNYQDAYKEGIITIVDDSHGVAAFGETGRGCEEYYGAKVDLVIGTLGKGFGADGGYVVGDQLVIDYLRESAATYIYSNSISPGTAGAALTSVRLVQSTEGQKIIQRLHQNIAYFKEKIKKAGFTMAADSDHPVQPLLIGDALKCQSFAKALFEAGFIVTNLSYPVVAKGKDEIRVQISAAHTERDLDAFIEASIQCGTSVGILNN